MVKLSLPVFVSVAVSVFVWPCAVFGKLRDVGESVTPTPVPVPLRVRVWGLPTPSSVTCKVAVSGPIIVGLKVTEKSQVPAGAMGELVRHVFVCEKSVLLEPVTVTPVIFKFAFPEFVSRIFSGGDVVPSANVPILAGEGLKATQPEGLVFALTLVKNASESAGVALQLAQVG